MLKIRLQRVGRKNIPTFRIVLTDSKNSTKSGKYLEVLGLYDPVNDVKEIKEDRVKHWMSKGAQLTDTLHNFLVEKKIISGKKINKLPRKSPIKKDEPAATVSVAPAVASAEKPSAPASETPAETPVESAKEEATAEPVKA